MGFLKGTGDQHVIMGVTSPDKSDYYYKNFGYYNWINIPADVSGEKYKDILIVAPEINELYSVIYYSGNPHLVDGGYLEI